MNPEWIISAFIIIPLLIMLALSWYIQSRMNKSNEKLVQAMQETIQRLINREPVTYSEVGKVPAKKATDVYAAWGSQMVNIDEDEHS